jgi:sulfhydrogenase subunit beta (sulfur reductase)
MSTKTSELVITTDNLLQGIDKALIDYQIAALTKKNGQELYDYVTNSGEINLEYQPTVLSPKKFFFPQEEVILEYTPDGKIGAKIEANPLILFGVRPCDLNGFKVLYEAFADDNGDPNYLAKLEKSLNIGIDCKKICDEHAFCFKVGSQNATGGFDVMLYELGNGYAIETASEKGRQFVDKYLTTSKAKGDELSSFRQQKEAGFGKEKPFKNLEKFPETFEKNKHHPVWEQEGSRCLSCGSCIMVCPTCYCFDVKDEWQLNLKKGERKRKWDACMLSSFSTIGSGENFRHKATARLHHRINRKFNFLMQKHGQSVCVGCGRCVRACLAEISPKKIAAAINGE